MKKLLLSAAAFALVASTMTSCKKDYSCDCTYTVGGVTETDKYPIKDAKKKDAEAACDTWSLLHSTDGKCELN